MQAYEEVEWLGKGSFGEVTKVRRRDNGRLFACKVITVDRKTNSDQIEREVRILKNLTHANIVRYVEYDYVKNTSSESGTYLGPPRLRLYMEFCPGGSLQDLIETHKTQQTTEQERSVWQAISQLSSALRYCHYGTRLDGTTETIWQPIFHRDIKPANVLVFGYEENTLIVKLADFGLATVVDPEAPPATYAGTNLYLPPEISRSNQRGVRWSKFCDIFSLGSTFYTFCALESPFCSHMEAGDKYSRLPDQYSDRLNACVARCLEQHPHERHDAWELVQISRSFLGDGESVPGDTSEQKPPSDKSPKLSPSGAIDARKANGDVISNQPVTTIPSRQRDQGSTRRPVPSEVQNSPATLKDKDSTNIVGVQCPPLDPPLDEAEKDILYDLMGENTNTATVALYEAMGGLGSQSTDVSESSNLETNLVAERWFRRAHTVAVSLHGPMHLDVLMLQYGLMLSLFGQKKLVEVMALLDMLLPALANLVGTEDERVLQCVYFSGRTSFEQGDFKKAIVVIQGAGRCYEYILKNNFMAGECSYWLGRSQFELDDLANAEESFKKGLSLIEPFSDENDMALGYYLYWLARIKFRHDENAESISLVRKALAIFQLAAEGNQYRARCLHLLALVMEFDGDIEGAKEVLLEAVPVHVETFGNDHESTADRRYALGRICYERGEYAEAEIQLCSALETFVRVYESGKSTRVICFYLLAIVQYRNGSPEAEGTLREAEQECTKAYGVEDTHTKECLRLLQFIERKKQRKLKHRHPGNEDDSHALMTDKTRFELDAARRYIADAHALKNPDEDQRGWDSYRTGNPKLPPPARSEAKRRSPRPHAGAAQSEKKGSGLSAFFRNLAS